MPATVAPVYPDPDIARGVYIVQGLGHCGACHTPRGFAMQEVAMSEVEGPRFLGGAVVQHWVAKSLRSEASSGLGGWSEDDIVEFLATGRTERAAVFGGMCDVIEHSMQYLTEYYLRATARYLKSLPAPTSRDIATRYDPSVTIALHAGDDTRRGAAVYLDNCAACHRTDGKGYPRVFPALEGNSVVATLDPSSVVQIILKGAQVPATIREPATFAMPAFAWRLNDEEVAEVATFVRSSWGNSANAVTTAEVRSMRANTHAVQFQDGTR